jgi:hypothetical protein
MRIALFSLLAFAYGSASATTLSNVTPRSKEAASSPATYSIIGKSNDLDIQSLKTTVMQRARAFCAQKCPEPRAIPIRSWRFPSHNGRLNALTLPRSISTAMRREGSAILPNGPELD